MSLRKFISGVTAFAVAASAFAAMAVTASAVEYKDVSASGGHFYNLTNNALDDPSQYGTYKVTNSDPGYVVAYLDGLKDIDYATSVTVQFDTVVPLLNAGGKKPLAKILFGVGDKKVRGENCNGSNADNYVKGGLITYFGSSSTSEYFLHDLVEDNYAQSVYNKTVRATITLNRKTGDYNTTLKAQGSSKVITEQGHTDVDNITVIEAFTWGAPATYNVTLKNVKVTYTVPSFEPVNWEYVNGHSQDDTGYTFNANEAAKDGATVYAYKANFEHDGSITYNVKANLKAIDNKELKEVSFGNLFGDAVLYIITNRELKSSAVYGAAVE